MEQQPQGFDADSITQDICYNFEHEEEAATELSLQLEISDTNYPKIAGVVNEFITSYKHKADNISDKKWLVASFIKYKYLWKNKGELESDAENIINAIEQFENSKNELDTYLKSGKSKNSWIAKKIEQGAVSSGIQDTTVYSRSIENAVDIANMNMIKVLHRQYDGMINQNPNLDGFIAEQYHVDTFNMDAAVKQRPFYAEAQNSTNLNSVDIFIKDFRGGIVRKYQSKYGADAEQTAKYFSHGNYRGQRKLVPQGQADLIPNSTDKIEFHGISSTPLSKEDAKHIQETVQKNNVNAEYTWNELSRIDIARTIGQKAGLAALLAAGFQCSRIVGRRIINSLSGKENKTIAEDIHEFVTSSLASGITAGVTTAMAGGMTVAIKSGWLGRSIRNTPVGAITSAVCIGVENTKILYKYAKGELTSIEATDNMATASYSLIGGIAGAAKGSSIGSAIGAAFSPIGVAVGGIVGGMVGGIAGSTVGEAVYKASKKIVKTVCTGIKTVANGIKNTVKAVGRALVVAKRVLFG